jgi:acetate kinase
MGNLNVVLNAGSSSLKFTIYADTGEKPAVLYDGQIEGLFTESRFKSKDGSGTIVMDKSWPNESALDHEGAIEALFVWSRGGSAVRTS